MSKSQIPLKPSDVTWTDDQWKAIMANGQDILVAAAAGSGKTAVLVERIIQKVISDTSPIDVDQLLVVTFTNASAAEMRHRIGEALERAINVNPTSTHLRKQLNLLNRASISTLHSFCLEVIRKYYYLIDLDPGFRIADETEVQLLRDEVMDEIFEDEYGKEDNEAFFELVDSYTNDRSDLALQDIVKDIFDFAQSNPAPLQYLQEIVRMYEVENITELEQLPFVQPLLFEIELRLEGAKELLKQGLEITKQPGGPAPRAENFLDDLNVVEVLIQASKHGWQTLYNAMQTWEFTRAKSCRGDSYHKDLVENAQKLREKAKKLIKDTQIELFSRRPESFLKDMAEMKPHIETLVSLVEKFSIRFREVKSEKGLVDFADLEHYCLEILTESIGDNGMRLPSNAALAYRNHFQEVLVDEYQDTNMVQEAILRLISKEDEQNGNLFMVGDVKQSIYRFRLAEPNLFLGKYLRFSSLGENSGLRIDLNKNFRSRSEVLDGTNFIFKQIMGEQVGEIDYDEAAELKIGASYPESETPIEVLLIDSEAETSVSPENEDLQEEDMTAFDLEELEQSQLEARLIASKIKEMVQDRAAVYNPKEKASRSIKYRDIVILLRSMTWAPQIMEEFKKQGIPVYANLSNGYFEATEVSIMLSLLKVIDNPYQDIPLAAVLRSPIVGLTEDDLAKIRMTNTKVSFYEALTSFCHRKPENNPENEEIHHKSNQFIERLNHWRSLARRQALSDLIWQLYRDTRFYDFVGGMSGGKQRQANLRALYDRARQYEATSFRGLFRFLRFIERMRDRGDDLGAARALGEQEDVVRLMTIHSSKGLEFPVVFVAGMARGFNTLDLKRFYMLDKEHGFAAKYVNAKKRIAYPSLPLLAFKRKKKLEMLAEEMRILYVALTRAKEKLYLIGSLKDSQSTLEKWSGVCGNPNWLLSNFERASANSYLDWVGPSLVRHPNCTEVLVPNKNLHPDVDQQILSHSSSWEVYLLKPEEVSVQTEEEKIESDHELEWVLDGQPAEITSDFADQINKTLSWHYPFYDSVRYRSKQSVSELKRQKEIADQDGSTEIISQFKKPLLKRPLFMQEKQMSPAEKGTAMHSVMQHLDLKKPITISSIREQVNRMFEKELLTKEQAEVIEPELIFQFFETELGKRLTKAKKINREIPFTFALSANEVYHEWNDPEEKVFIQGVIDCLFEDDNGTVLLDYKTDRISDRFRGGFSEAKPILESRYRIQMKLYQKAIEQILGHSIDETFLYFFDGCHVVKIEK